MSPDRKTYLAPSILSADFAKIEDAISLIENAGGDFVHMDVMDGVFVPNLTFGDKMVMDVRRLTKLPLDVHLMVANPESHIPRFLDAGADYLTFHFEATVHVHRALQSIKDAGKKAGISIVPSTPVNFLSEILDMVDLVLIMSVNPGFGGQKTDLYLSRKGKTVTISTGKVRLFLSYFGRRRDWTRYRSGCTQCRNRYFCMRVFFFSFTGPDCLSHGDYG